VSYSFVERLKTAFHNPKFAVCNAKVHSAAKLASEDPPITPPLASRAAPPCNTVRLFIIGFSPR
jgi:hypothetical protein